MHTFINNNDNGTFASMMIFNEGYERIMFIVSREFQLMVGDDGNIGTDAIGAGTAMVICDCLQLAIEMTRSDGMGAELFLGSRALVVVLCGFLDIRYGRRYRFGNEMQDANGGMDKDDDDDLDSLLGKNDKGEKDEDKQIQNKISDVPYIIEDEERVVNLTLELILTLIKGDDKPGSKKRKTRQASTLAHDPLRRLLIDLALYALPPPGSPRSYYISAVPTLKVQIRALEVLAALADGADDKSRDNLLDGCGMYIPQVSAMERLMFLICTGGYIPTGDDENTKNLGKEEVHKFKSTSLHALAVLRASLTPESASTAVLHALAPPPPTSPPSSPSSESKPTQSNQELSVVRKLANTLSENLSVLFSREVDTKDNSILSNDRIRININACGSAGALGTFLERGGSAAGEMMLRIMVPSLIVDEHSQSEQSLIECAVCYIESRSDGTTGTKAITKDSNPDILIMTLKLLCEWVKSCPTACADAMLRCSGSACFGPMIRNVCGSTPDKDTYEETTIIQAFTCLLLGLCMDGMGKETNAGGWTRSGIADIIGATIGAGGYARLLEGAKKVVCSVNAPWGLCRSEIIFVSAWYSDCVSVARRSTVKELAVCNMPSSDANSSQNGSLHNESPNGREALALADLAEQQGAEIEELRNKLLCSKQNEEELNADLNMWKRRAESNPTQLDDMLNEYVEKVAILENKVKAAEDYAQTMKSQHTTAMQEQDGKIEQLIFDLEKEKATRSTIEAERNSTAEELKGLSSAYTSLESDHNCLLASSSSKQETSTTVVEGSQQANGDDTTEADNIRRSQDSAISLQQYEAINAENVKLKNDIRAANNWMGMAVKRMENMEKENIDIQNRIQQEKEMNLREDSSQITSEKVTSTLSKISALESDVNRKEFELQQLQQEVVESKADFESLKSKLDATVGDYNIIKREVADLHRIKDYTESELSQAKFSSAKSNELAQEFANLKLNLSAATKNVKAARKDVMERDKETSLLKLDLESAIKKIREKEDEVVDLKSQLNNTIHSAGLTTDQSAKLKEEIIHLKSSNKAAKDWMANAVKHNEAVSKKLRDKVEENKTLTSQLESLHSSNKSVDEQHNFNSVMPSKILHLETKVKSLMNARDEARDKLKELEVQLDEKENELSSTLTNDEKIANEITSLRNKLSLKEDDNQKLKDMLSKIDESNREGKKIIDSKLSDLMNNLKSKDEELKNTKNSLDHMKKEFMIECNQAKADKEEEIEKCTKDKLMMKEKIDSLLTERDKHICAIEDLRNKLTDFQSWTETAQLRIAELEDDKEASLEKMTKLEEEKIQALEEALVAKDQVKEENNDKEILQLEEELRRNLSVISNLECNMHNLRKNNDQLSDDIKVKTCDLNLLTESAKSLESMNSNLKEEIDRLKKFDGIISEREREIRDLELDLDSVRKELEETHKICNEYSSLEALNAKLEAEVKSYKDLDDRYFEKEEQLTDLEGELATKKKELEESQMNGERISIRWQEQYSELEICQEKTKGNLIEAESEIIELKSKCDLAKENNANLIIQINELNSRSNIQEEQLKTKEVELEDLTKRQEKEKNERLHIQNKMKETEKIFKDYVKEMESTLNEHVDTIEDLQRELEINEETREKLEEQVVFVSDLEEKVAILTKELVESREQSEEVVTQWQDNAQQLEATITELEKTIEGQHVEADEAISKWEERCNNLSEQIEEMEKSNTFDSNSYKNMFETKMMAKNEELMDANSQLNVMKTILEEVRVKFSASGNIMDSVDDFISKFNSLEVKNEELKKTNDQILINFKNEKKLKEELIATKENENAGLRTKLEDKDKAIHTFEFQMKDEQNHLRDQIRILEEKKLTAENQVESMNIEINELRVIIGQLEDELKGTNDAIQAHLTDEMSIRATEMASDALRSQLNEMKNVHLADKNLISNEIDARVLAEQEIDRLKADLMLMCQANNDSENIDGRIRKLTSKAADSIVKNERREIQELRTSLDRVMKEMRICRAKEKDAEERAASARLHASVCEQELLAAKSDYSHLQDAMRELEQSEENNRSVLEFRIDALEDEVAATIRSRDEEVETLKSEIAQGQLARDGLAYSLNESKKANSALVYSSTVENGDNIAVQPEKTELSKLRLEKAQLLVNSSEIGSQTERRIREAIAANNSLKETEIIIERELREAAESERDDLQHQLNDAKKLFHEGKKDYIEGHKSSSDDLGDHEKDLKKEISILSDANKELKLKLEQTEADAKSLGQRLNDKCRLAEAKAREVERAGYFEAAVSAEVAKLRDESLMDFDNVITKSEGSNSNSSEVVYLCNNDLPTEGYQAFNYVNELKSAVKEERSMYHDLLQEHEELLELLAQQNLEKENLQLILKEVGGQDAMDEALQRIEEISLQKFGKFIRIH